VSRSARIKVAILGTRYGNLDVEGACSAVSEVIRVLRGRIPKNLVNKDLLG